MPAAVSVAGAAAAAALFSSRDTALWSHCLNLYDEAIAEASAKKQGQTDLAALDSWLRSDWRAQGQAKAKGLTRAALEKVATWKLTRGQWRPLLPRIKSNAEPAVAAAWRAALDARAQAESKPVPAAASAAVAALAAGLDGVGPATASA
ncbi:unnamed protein product, partial [Polarella glacialis]